MGQGDEATVSVPVPGYQRFPGPEAVRLAAGRAALEHPAVAGYYTAGGHCSTTTTGGERFRNSFHPQRSGDVMLSYQPEYVEDYGQGRGISYGSLYNYDVRVPLCFYGPQFPAGVFESAGGSGGRGAHPGARHGRGAAFLLGRPRAGRGLRQNDARNWPRRFAASRCATRCWRPRGTFAYGVEFEKLVDLNALGGLVVKGLSREPIEGNPPPRVYETEGGMINSDRPAEHRRARLRQGQTAGAGPPAHGGFRQRVRLPGGRLRGSGARAERSRRAWRATS